MAISNDLNSIRTHLEDDYTALETLGVSVEDRNIENIKDMAQQIYAKFPKTDYAEGSNITLSNTLKGKLDFEDGIVWYGQTEQKSYEGYQLIPYTLETLKTINTSGTWNNNKYAFGGITYTIQQEEGHITGILTEGTAASTNSFLYLISSLNITAGTYYVSGCPNGGSVSTYFIYAGSGLTHNTSDTPTKTILNEDVSLTSNNLRITIINGTNANNLVWKPMLSKTNTTDFEPFVGNSPSPNPSYPQDIEVVRGTQTVYIKDENNNIIDTKTINLGEYEFAKIGTYRDTIEYDVDEDKVYKNEKVGKAIFNGSETWVYSSGWSKTNTNVFFRDSALQNALYVDSDAIYGKCNYFIAMSRNFLNEADTDGISYSGSLNLPQLTVRINKSIATDVNAFKSWLLSHNLDYYYILATPVKTEITDTTLKDQIKALYYSHSFTGTTIIEIDGQLPLIIKVRALKGE